MKSGRFPPTNKLKGNTRKNSEKPNILWHPGCFRRFLVQRLGAWYSIWILKVGAKLKGCNGCRRPSMLGIHWSMLNFGCACAGCAYHRPYTRPCEVHPLTHTQTKWPPHMLWAHHSMPGHRVRPVEVTHCCWKKLGSHRVVKLKSRKNISKWKFEFLMRGIGGWNNLPRGFLFIVFQITYIKIMNMIFDLIA